MHTRASNSELVEPLLEPERTLNRRRRRRNRRVPFDQRNNPPKNPRIVYPPILDINHFRHFLVTLENLYPMDDEPMWAADHVVAPTPGSAITIPETANEFAIKGNHLTLVNSFFDNHVKTSKMVFKFLQNCISMLTVRSSLELKRWCGQYIAITGTYYGNIITHVTKPQLIPASPQCLHQRLHLPANAEETMRKPLIYCFAIPDRTSFSFHDDLMQGLYGNAIKAKIWRKRSIKEDAYYEEIDIRWQVAMITARIRKFMRKTGRSIDLKPKNGITFDKSKIECFNCQKLGHFARECRFAKYQENRANGRQEKRIVAIEDSNSKALVATDNNEDIDWTKEFDAEPVTYAMMALTGVEQDDWSIEFDAEHMHFGQDGLDDFDWSNKADDAPVSLALMATNSEVPYCSKCSKSYKLLLENYQKERDNFQRARTEILGYQMSLGVIRERKQKELDQALKERDDFKVKLEKWSNASVLQNEVLNKQRYVSDKSCIGFGIESSNSMESNISSGDETLTDSAYENFKREKAYKAVPPPTGTIIPPRANVSFTGIDELAIRNKVVNQEKTKSSQSAIDRNKVIIEDWVDSDDEETDVSESQKETVFNSENSETSFENRSPNSQNSVGQESRTKGLGNKGGKLCFVCYSPNHLIKDCNLHERTFKHTQTHKPKGTQGSRETRPVWNNIQRVNHSNFSRNSRYPHQRRSFIPSAVLTRDGLISTARPKMTQTVPSKSTANVTYQGTARSRVPQAVLSRSTDGSYYPRMDNRRPRISSYSPSSRSSTTRTPHRPQRPKKIVKSIWVKKGSTVGNPKQYFHKPGNPEEDLKDYAIIDSGCSGSMTGDKDKLSDFKEFKGGYVAFGNDSKDKECLILSPKFKFVDEDLVILRAPRKNDVYSLDLKNIIPSGGITCLVAKATEDEAILWQERLGHDKLQKLSTVG
ncbi:ribonuclease H-like domain-containing protein [Tanacetum coccineum]